jgi:SRSO17 transposase
VQQRREGWSPRQLASCRRRLEGFAEDVFSSLARCDQRSRGLGYVRGLLLVGKRKSCEPMAARLGDVHPQALHHFLQASPWDWGLVRRRLAELACQALDPEAWIIDDTSFPKDGDWSVGVARQYSGTLGKVANCQVGVSVSAAGERGSCPVDWQLFLPQCWDDDHQRRQAAHLPPQQRHRPKWQLALALLDELAGWGMPRLPVTSDAGYGEVPAFRLGLETRGLVYVVGVPQTASAYPAHADPSLPAWSGRGRRPRRRRYQDRPQSVRDLVLAAGQSACVDLIWRRGSRGMQRSRFVALPVRPAGKALADAYPDGLPLRWLLAEWPTGQAEPTRYWLSNLPLTTPVVELVRLAKLRWRIEGDYRDQKDALGLDHHEGRSWQGWHHHVTLVSAAHLFCTLERLRPRPRVPAQR